jgi:hypothetical protein
VNGQSRQIHRDRKHVSSDCCSGCSFFLNGENTLHLDSCDGDYSIGCKLNVTDDTKSSM